MQNLYLKPLLLINARILDQMAIMKDSIKKNKLDIEKCICDFQKLEESTLSAKQPKYLLKK